MAQARRAAAPGDAWGALTRLGLAQLSPPELDHALRELTVQPRAFLGVLAAAADWPRASLIGTRIPSVEDIDRLDRRAPRARAVVSPDDPRGLAVAATFFQAVLVLDPFWPARGALYGAWHAAGRLAPHHAAALLSMAAPSLRLAPLRAAGALFLIPDHLPGSWEPWPMLPDSARPTRPLDGPLALHAAARLVYWADRLDGVCVAGHAELARALRDLAGVGPDLSGAGRELPLRLSASNDLPMQVRRRATLGARGRRWLSAPVLRQAIDGRKPGRALRARGQQIAPADEAPGGQRWLVGSADAYLPDVSLALRRAIAGQPVRGGARGRPIPLRRPPVYLVPQPDSA